MPRTERKDIFFKSANGKNKIAAYFYEDKDVKPQCILQIVHGMCEYITRYDEFAAFMAANGVVVCGNDHLGHGNSVNEEKEYGHFTENGGRRFVLRDIWEMNRLAKEKYPGLPLVMLGHSMGSFLARKYVVEWPETIDAFIISGTSGPVKSTGMGSAVAMLISKIRGSYHRSKLLHALAFGPYVKKLGEYETVYDWISRDKEIVNKYAKDPRCTFIFTANGFHELFNALKDVSSPEWAQAVNKQMPVLIFGGDADPVGQYGEGLKKVHGWLKDAGVEKLELKIYPGGRHEMLNEINRQEVYEDILKFIKSINFNEN